MDTWQGRLSRLDSVLSDKQQIYSSEDILSFFPTVLKKPFMMDGVRLVIYRQGSFTSILSQRSFSARADDTPFLPKDSLFQVLCLSTNAEVFIFIYQTDPIRDIIGNSIVFVNLYSHLATGPCYVWNIGKGEEVLKHLSLLDSTLNIGEDTLNRHERKLFSLALTYGLCSVYIRKLIAGKASVSHRHNVFIRLIQSIGRCYTKEWEINLYTNRLYLSPKYLSTLSKSICGYTVQELVSKSVIRKNVSLLKSTQRGVQEISDFSSFPNTSYSGTFLKKQAGVSPQQYYRRQSQSTLTDLKRSDFKP